MCTPASGITTKNNVYVSIVSNSHSDILEENEIRNFKKTLHFVKWTITPPSRVYTLPLSKWVYNVAQDEVPAWYVEAVDEKRAFKVMEEWKKYHCVYREGHHLVGGFNVTFKGDFSSILTGGDKATLTGASFSTLTGGSYSTLTGGYGSTLTGGIDSILIIRQWEEKAYKTYTKVVSDKEEGISFTVENGKWKCVKKYKEIWR